MTSFLFIFLIFSPTCLAENPEMCIDYYDSYLDTFAISNCSNGTFLTNLYDCAEICKNETTCVGFNYNDVNELSNCDILCDIISYHIVWYYIDRV